jgi:calcium/calmodulin-dependent protein kinase (CaM kinase) II
MNAATKEQDTILSLTRQLLEAIASKDWSTYQQLTDPSLTCFEPEACGQLVEGLPFHQFYFQLGGGSRPGNVTMAQAHVRIMGDVAVVAFVRLNQAIGPDGPQTVAFEETRVWQKQNGSWKHVHFHRSEAGRTRKD